MRAAGSTGERGPRVEVALPLPVRSTFTYLAPDPIPAPGTRVLVPFGRRERIGWTVGRGEGEGSARLRRVLAVLEEEPSAPPDILALARWMADYYVAPLGVCLAAALPSVLTDASRDVVEWVGPLPSEARPRVRRLAEALAERAGSQRVSTVRKALAMGSIWPEVRELAAAGLLTHAMLPAREPASRTLKVVRLRGDGPSLAEREEVFRRAGRQRQAYERLEAGEGSEALGELLAAGFSRSVIAGLEAKGLVEVLDEERVRDPFRGSPGRDTTVPPPLTSAQTRAVAVLVNAFEAGGGRPVLLHGVTGSGKTRVYIELLQHVHDRGRGAIVLVPEISLTPQTVRRFRARFGEQIAVLHSGLSQGERYDAWRQLRRGDRTIAVGARSALFAPVPALGAIVVDEEHDGSYKQSEAPRYHARDLAVVRARAAGAVCVLGSATPSLESWSNAGRGKFGLAELPTRVAEQPLPPVRLVDLRRERARRADAGSGTGPERGGGVLSPPLVEAMDARLERGEQAILLLNRRGYSSFVQCRECGDVCVCPNCSVSLTYHRASARVLCHHCRHEEAAPRRCARCGSADLSFRGLGTEQVERVVVETFPRARIARMDVDTTSGKWAHHEILGRVERGEVDILLGTQMIAKGLDFPRVTLVGVVNADVGMHLPDFRACERTFQLLAQVAGRTGRSELGGEVIIQTSLTEHYVLQAAITHDYLTFARRELDERRRPAYPPHVRLANVVFSSPQPDQVADEALRAADWMRRWLTRPGAPAVELVGPAPAPIERLHGRWRWHFLLRSASARGLGSACVALSEGFRARGRDVRLALDRDPTALL